MTLAEAQKKAVERYGPRTKVSVTKAGVHKVLKREAEGMYSYTWRVVGQGMSFEEALGDG